MEYELNLDGARKILPGDDLSSAFWSIADLLPTHAIVALGWADSMSYWVKGSAVSFHWMLAQSDNEALPVGYIETADPETLTAGGDIDVAYLVTPPANGDDPLSLADLFGEAGLSHTDIAAILDRTEAL
jgi:hypothetical protein